MLSKWAADSTATGTSTGPDAAKPTKQATSIRGSHSESGGDSASNRKPGSRLVTTRFNIERPSTVNRDR
jgi:hypothetical protein